MLSEKFWNHYFESYDILNRLTPYQDLMSKFILGLKEYNNKLDYKSILDLGSGTGNLIASIIKEYPKVRIIGIDYSHAAIRISKIKFRDNSNVSIFFGDLNNPLPFNHGSMDVVVMNNVLYTINIENRQRLFNEIYKVMSPKGVLIVSSINDKFNPFSIYVDHIRRSIMAKGLPTTLYELFKFILPTLKIFYFNFRIRVENKAGSYEFVRRGEQVSFMKSAGFKITEEEKEVYSGNAYFCIGIK